MSNCVNCGLAIVPPGVTWAGMSCRCFTETGRRLGAELDAIRSRLQALEQNTVPSSPAPPKPRELWVVFFDGVPTYVERDLGAAEVLAGLTGRVMRVREVLDE